MTRQEELAELDGQLNRARTDRAQASNALAAEERRGPQLEREQARHRLDGIRRGRDARWHERDQELSDAISAHSAAVAEHHANLEAATRAERDVETERAYLLHDHIDVFCTDAAKLSLAARKEFQAALPAISRAVEASQAAQLAWAKLGPALRQVLREHDEAAGVYRDAGVYGRLATYPRFPIQVADANWTATPPGAVLLTRKPKRTAA